jgi:hypothetical protein
VVTWNEMEWPPAAVTFVMLMTAAEVETPIAYRRSLRQSDPPGAAGENLHPALPSLEPTGPGSLPGIAREEPAGTGGRPRRTRPAGPLPAKEDDQGAASAPGLRAGSTGRIYDTDLRAGPPGPAHAGSMGPRTIPAAGRSKLLTVVCHPSLTRRQVGAPGP